MKYGSSKNFQQGTDYHSHICQKQAKLKAGDKIVILEENGRFYFENSAMLAFKRAEDAFAGEAEKAGFSTEEEMQDYMKEIRREVRGY